MRQANRAAEALRDELNATKAEARRLQAQLTEVEAETKAEAKRTVTELREESDGAKAEVRRLEQLLSNAQADTDAARAEARRLQAHSAEEAEAMHEAKCAAASLQEELDAAKAEARRLHAQLAESQRRLHESLEEVEAYLAASHQGQAIDEVAHAREASRRKNLRSSGVTWRITDAAGLHCYRDRQCGGGK